MGILRTALSKVDSYRKHRWKVMEDERRRVVVNLFKKYCGKGRVLDFGCGSGILLEILADLKGLELVGIDINENAINEASRRLKGKGVDLRLGSLDTIGDKERFDCVICGEVLEHVNRPEKYISAFPRQIVEGGLYIVVLPYLWELINCPRDAIVNRYLSNIRNCEYGLVERLFFKRAEGMLRPTWLVRTLKPMVHDYDIHDYVTDYMKGAVKGPYHKHWFDYYRLERMLETAGFAPKELVYVGKRQYMVSASIRP